MEQWIQRTVGCDIEIEVDASIVVEDEIAQGVNALNGVGVGCVGRDVGGVVGLHEFEARGVGPELKREERLVSSGLRT